MYSYTERMRAVELYLKYDMSIAAVIRELGYPSRGMLYLWHKEFIKSGSLHSDSEKGYSKYNPEQRKQAIEYYLAHGKSISRTMVRYTQEQQEQAVILLCAGDGTAKEIAADFGVAETSLRRWKKCLLSKGCSITVSGKRELSAETAEDQGDLIAERDMLMRQVEELQKDIHRLQLERDILEKADEI